MRFDTRDIIEEALEDYERDVTRALTVHAYREYVEADVEATKVANRDNVGQSGPKFDPMQWAVIDRAALGYIEQYRQTLTNEGATTINGQKIPWLKAFTQDARSDMVDAIERGIQEGLRGKGEVEKMLRPIFEGTKHRAQTVARTETAQIRGEAKAKRWKERGYSVVRITDGRGSNPCDICPQYDGQYWTVEYYHTHITEHPNCTRAASPVRPESIPAGTFIYGLGNVEIPKVKG